MTITYPTLNPSLFDHLDENCAADVNSPFTGPFVALITLPEKNLAVKYKTTPAIRRYFDGVTAMGINASKIENLSTL